MRNALVTFVCLIAATILIPGGLQMQKAKPTSTTWKTPWSYEGTSGPDHWGDLDPDYAPCKDGKEQSPIDIRGEEKADLPALRFEYKSGPLNIINNGYTAVRVDYVHSGDFLIAGEKRYELTQFHFHRPSEEYIHGKQFDMVLHLMHKDSDGKIAGVAVLLRTGTENSEIQKLWKYMSKTPSDVQQIAEVEINPANLLPRGTGYYMYAGSQTAPPCTEGVTWFVLEAPLHVSAEQINAFAQLYPHDVRPVQLLNGRVVKESR